LRVIHASALFATCLRTNPRSLENWEQGRANSSAQAALLIALGRNGREGNGSGKAKVHGEL
jgi:DNA-binding transcriptional regulator YiaG